MLEVAKKIKEEVGDVTILINNAGIMPCLTLMNHTPEQIKRIFDINVLAHFWVIYFTLFFIKRFLPYCTRELNNLSA